ncbi:MAG: hypothetical protein ISR73_08935 [Gammaproteobacteria bacterium]|nr:hypothetical protein [Gammaproteobacteria bacterium]
MPIIRPYSLFASILLFSLSTSVSADINQSLMINDDIEVDIVTIGNPARTGVIWLACHQGNATVEFNTARKLTDSGYQFYFPDMLSAHFLAPTPSNIDQVPSAEVIQVIQHIIAQSKAERIYLIGAARAAVPVLKALADPALKNSDKLKAALLITPRINKKTPEPGSEPEYIDEAGSSIHTLRVLEGERTPNRWGLPHLKNVLARSGSPVQTDIIPGVRGFFYLRADKTPQELSMTDQLDQLIHFNLQKLGDI